MFLFYEHIYKWSFIFKICIKIFLFFCKVILNNLLSHKQEKIINFDLKAIDFNHYLVQNYFNFFNTNISIPHFGRQNVDLLVNFFW